MRENPTMPNLALRGIPAGLHRELKEAAARNHRSLNGEIIARLTASVDSAPLDVEALLDRIARRHETLGAIDLSPDNVRRLRDEGRR
ncbi:MAG: Arc family DNA-binding protein [Gemmatimonadales bacterium]|nr:Arc family DNA-binding protein [Gemmatimonadales bacterium]MYG49125.1 Arc family DNA-binding protein [Gemmatimonadales bacterium]MYK01900.1 Arc family DNA-binding protein [Candidatus Palauibacter ramosifaciens]